MLSNQVSYAIASKTPAASGADSLIFRTFARGYRNIVIDLLPAGTVSYTLKFVKSNQDAEPDFTAAVSATNIWTYCDMIDLADGASIDGATGIALTTTTPRSLEYNNNAAQWFGVICTTYATGTVSGNALLTNNV